MPAQLTHEGLVSLIVLEARLYAHTQLSNYPVRAARLYTPMQLMN